MLRTLQRLVSPRYVTARHLSNMLRVLLCCACCLACTGAKPPSRAASDTAAQLPERTVAAPAPEQHSPGFAWSVIGTATTLTLVGSIHVGFDGLYPLPEPVEQAFRESTLLAMELALDQEPPERVAQLMLEGATLPKGQTLHDCLSARAWLRYQEFAAQHTDQATFFDRFRPWFVAVFLSGEQSTLDGYDPSQGLDMYFFRRRGSRKVIGVEKAEEHVSALSNLPAATQELMLLEQLDALDHNDDELAAVTKLWQAGDAAGLAREMFSEFNNPTYSPVYQALIVKRNERMTQQIEAWLGGKERIFVLLGAGHFVGPDGIVAKLQKDGWVPHRL